MELKTETLEQQGINTVRILAADAVQKANSGHPGTPMACTCWSCFMGGKHEL